MLNKTQQEFLDLFYIKCPHCGAMYAISERTNRNGFDVCPECWNRPDRRANYMQKEKQLDFNFPKVVNLDYKQKYYKCLIAMNEFNSLPWWKRLFYRFDIGLFRCIAPNPEDF